MRLSCASNPKNSALLGLPAPLILIFVASSLIASLLRAAVALEEVKLALNRAGDNLTTLEQIPVLPPAPKLGAGVDDAMSFVSAVTEQRSKRKRDEEILKTSLDSLRLEKKNLQFTGVESDSSCRLKRRKTCVKPEDVDDFARANSDAIPVICENRACV